MTARELRHALARVPDPVLDRLVTWESEYALKAVKVEGGGLCFAEHVVLGEHGEPGADGCLAYSDVSLEALAADERVRLADWDRRNDAPFWVGGAYTGPLALGPGPIVPLSTSAAIQIVGVPLCPDLLRYEIIGQADGWRGRVVRALFWLLRVWPPRR